MPEKNIQRMNKIINKIIIGSLLGALAFIVLAFFADFKQVVSAVSIFPAGGWPLLLLLSLSNYAIRAIKWDFYLRQLGIFLPKISSVLIFLSGFIMAITPGKMGEVLKSLLIFEHYKYPITQTAPAVFADRMADVLALLLLSAAGFFYKISYFYSSPKDSNISQLTALAAFVIITAVLIFIISSKTFNTKILKLAEKISFIKKYIVHIEELLESARILIMPWSLIYTTLLSVAAWAMECYSLYYIIKLIAPEVSIDNFSIMMICAFIYSFSTLVGAAAMIPGGLFVTEGGMSFLLVNFIGITLPAAVAASFLVRAATLWFALLIGIFALPSFNVYIKNNTTAFQEPEK